MREDRARPRRAWWWGCLVALLAGLTGPAGCRPAPKQVPPTESSTQTVVHLVGLMRQRLDLMGDVARWKWNHEKPIADPAREKELLDEVSDRAAKRGLDRDLVRRFFAAQIEAAKLIQQAEHNRWRAAGQKTFADVPSLDELRRRIDTLNAGLLDALESAGPALREVRGQAALVAEARVKLHPDEVRELAVAPLRQR